MINNTSNLQTFKILFIVKGILNLLFTLFFLFYMMMGDFIDNIPEFDQNAQDIPFQIAQIFYYVGGIGAVLTIVFGVVTLLAAKFIGERRNYNFIFVVAILNGLTGILGILLCVFTLIELTKPHVKQLFQEDALIRHQ